MPARLTAAALERDAVANASQRLFVRGLFVQSVCPSFLLTRRTGIVHSSFFPCRRRTDPQTFGSRSRTCVMGFWEKQDKGTVYTQTYGQEKEPAI